MQNEYKRGISGWNFNLDDMKAQASLVYTYSNRVFPENILIVVSLFYFYISNVSFIQIQDDDSASESASLSGTDVQEKQPEGQVATTVFQYSGFGAF